MVKFLFLFIVMMGMSGCSYLSIHNRNPQQVVGDIGGNRKYQEMVERKQFSALTCTMDFDIQVQNKQYKNVSCLNPLAEDGSFHCDDEKQKMTFSLVNHLVEEDCALENSVSTVRKFPVNNAYKAYDGAVVSLFMSGDPNLAKLHLRIANVKSLPNGDGARTTPVIGSDLVREINITATDKVDFDQAVDLKFRYGYGPLGYSYARLKQIHVECVDGDAEGNTGPFNFAQAGGDQENLKMRKNIVLEQCGKYSRNLTKAKEELLLWNAKNNK